MKPTIFLDIDGVIHPFTRFKDYPVDPNLGKKLAKERNNPDIENMNVFLVHMMYYRFDWKAIKYLEMLINEYDAQIVLSSSWRLMYSKTELKTMFSFMNFKDAYVDNLPSGKARYTLIKEYVKEHKIKTYLVIDDLNMTSYFHSKMILCHTSFSKENYLQARKELSKQNHR